MKFAADDFKSIKMPFTNGKVTKDIVLLDDCLRLINAKLQAWLADAPTVRGVSGLAWYPDKGTECDTHIAKIVCVEEIRDAT